MFTGPNHPENEFFYEGSAICDSVPSRTGTADSLPFLDGNSVYALISKGERAIYKCCPQVLWITDDVFDNNGNVRLSVDLLSTDIMGPAVSTKR